MSCSKIKHNCGKKNYAKCINYEGEVPEFTNLEDTDCLDIEEVIEDAYSLIEDIKEEIDLSDLDNECFTIPQNTKTKELFQLLINKICEQESTISELQETITTIQGQITDLQENNCP